MGLCSQVYVESRAATGRQFYALGRVFGTRGSIALKAHDDSTPRPDQIIVLSPSGTHCPVL